MRAERVASTCTKVLASIISANSRYTKRNGGSADFAPQKASTVRGNASAVREEVKVGLRDAKGL